MLLSSRSSASGGGWRRPVILRAASDCSAPAAAQGLGLQASNAARRRRAGTSRALSALRRPGACCEDDRHAGSGGGSVCTRTTNRRHAGCGRSPPSRLSSSLRRSGLVACGNSSTGAAQLTSTERACQQWTGGSRPRTGTSHPRLVHRHDRLDGPTATQRTGDRADDVERRQRYAQHLPAMDVDRGRPPLRASAPGLRRHGGVDGFQHAGNWDNWMMTGRMWAKDLDGCDPAFAPGQAKLGRGSAGGHGWAQPSGHGCPVLHVCRGRGREPDRWAVSASSSRPRIRARTRDGPAVNRRRWPCLALAWSRGLGGVGCGHRRRGGWLGPLGGGGTCSVLKVLRAPPFRVGAPRPDRRLSPVVIIWPFALTRCQGRSRGGRLRRRQGATIGSWRSLRAGKSLEGQGFRRVNARRGWVLFLPGGRDRPDWNGRGQSPARLQDSRREAVQSPPWYLNDTLTLAR